MFSWFRKIIRRKQKVPNFKNYDEYMGYKIKNLNPAHLTEKDRVWIEERKRQQTQEALLNDSQKKEKP